MKKYTKIWICAVCLLVMECSKNNSISTNSELPIFNIEFEDAIPVGLKVDMQLYETTNTRQAIYRGKMERRGGMSISFPKHSYEIDLNADIPLVGLPKDDDWILNANYIDKTFIRHVLCYELFSSMSHINIAPQCQYVELKLNGAYNGLYVLMEKLDKSSLKLAKADSMAMIFKEPHIFRETYEGINPQNADNFHQQTYPKIEKEDKKAFLEEIRDFILMSSDNDFENGISNIFDMQSIVDWHLLLLISNNGDGILKNFYLYKIDNETPIRIAPWDYDHSFGRDGDNELNLDERPLKIERSILFKRLLKFDWYQANLKKRWQELNDANILSVGGLKQSILTKSVGIQEAAKHNFKIWPIYGSPYYDSNNFEEEIDIMLQFVDLRHQRLSKYFGEM